jgi:hypothetical protein
MSAFAGLTDSELDALEYALDFTRSYAKTPSDHAYHVRIDELLDEARSEQDERHPEEQ